MPAHVFTGGRSRPWNNGQVKPIGRLAINWGHPLTQSLVFFGIASPDGNSIIDLTHFRKPTINAVDIQKNNLSAFGPGIDIENAGAQNTWQYPSDSFMQSLPPWTFVSAFVEPASVTNAQMPFARLGNSDSSPPYTNWAFKCDGAGTNMRFRVNSGGNPVTVAQIATASIPANSFVSLAGVASSTTNAAFYYNGGLVGSSGGLSITVTNSGDPICFGGDSAGTPWNGIIFYGAFWTRALDQTELLKLYLEPYCFLQPAEVEVPLIRAAPGISPDISSMGVIISA